MNCEQKKVITVPLGYGEEMVFRHVPAGAFRMGERGYNANEEPVTHVFVEEFWMGETPVTRGQYQVLAGRCLEQLEQDKRFQGIELYAIKSDEDRRRPVAKVSWDEARVVADWLTGEMKRLGQLPEGYRVDLPWESQWEKACRWGTETEYGSGDGKAALGEVGWFDEDSESGPYPVKSKSANGGGMSDWHGSIWQWCRDSWDGKRETSRLRLPGEAEPEERSDGEFRVLRGGSWGDAARYCRSAFRYWDRPGYRDWLFGFRLALVPGPGEQEAGGPSEGAEPDAAAVEARDEPEQAQAEGGASGWEDLKGPEVDRS